MNANLEILKSDINKALKRLIGYRKGNKRKATQVVVASAVLSALTTLCIGLAGYLNEAAPLYQSLALVFSACLTVVTAWDGLFNHKRLWLLQADIVNRLYDIQTDIQHLEASGALSQESINDLYIRYKNAFQEFNTQWQEMRADHEDDSNTK